MAKDSPRPVRLLAGDIGGTNARLVSYSAPADADFGDVKGLSKHEIILHKNYKNEDFLSFSAVLVEFLAEPLNAGPPFDACCFAVAGPVVNNQINFTNRDGWIIDRTTIMTDFGIKDVQLVNDFAASGYGLLALGPEEVITLQEGKPRPDAPIALIGAGTGLGECYLSPPTVDGDIPSSHPSEGGHVEFAPRSMVEEELLRHLQDTLGPSIGGDKSRVVRNGAAPDAPPLPDAVRLVRERISVERVVSGQGMANIYEFLRTRHPDQVDARIDAEYNETNERGRLIGKRQYNYPLFRSALEIMFGIYGSEAGNVALKYLPYGGLYVAGGIAPKNVELMQGADALFMERFREKGRMSSIMGDIPVHVVMKEDLGLRGAHIVASRLVWKMQKADSGMEKGAGGKGRRGKAVDYWRDGGFRRRSEYSLSAAIADYPLPYAAIVGATATATASMIVLGAVFLRSQR